MPKTAVGLFENPGLVDVIVREIEALGFPRKEVRELEEPATFDVTGVMSFPRLDFEAGLTRELTRIGNRYGALEVEAASGAEPHLPGVAREGIAPTGDSTVQTGRVREPSGSASCFVW